MAEGFKGSSGLHDFSGQDQDLRSLEKEGGDLVGEAKSQLRGEALRKKAGPYAAAAIGLTMAGATHANDNEMSDLEYYNYMLAQNDVPVQMILDEGLVAQQTRYNQSARSVLDSSRSSERSLRDEVGTIPDSLYVGGTVSGDRSEINASYVNGRFGVGAQLNRSKFGDTDIEQKSITVVAKLTPSEESALAQFLEDVEVKGTVTNSVVEGAIPFDEEAKVIEFTANLRMAFLKQVALSYGQHEVTVTGSAADWQQFNTITDIDTQFISNPFQNREITTTIVTNQKEIYRGGKVDTIGVKALLQFGERLDALITYTKDLESNGNKDDLKGIALNYKINNDYSVFGDYRKTTQYSGSEAQDVGTVGLSWNKNLDQRSGINIDLSGQNIDGNWDPRVMFWYRMDLGSKPDTSRNRLRSNIVTPATGALETNAHLITRDTRDEVTVTVSEKTDNLPNVGLSLINATSNSLTISYRLTDADDDVVGGLSLTVNGTAYPVDADGVGNITVDGLTPNTNNTVIISGNVTNNITGKVEFVSKQSTYKTLEAPVDPETPDDIAPEITVDETPITLSVGATFTPPTATCTDNKDADCDVIVTHNVDTNTPGEYEIVYTATDQAGNEAKIIVPVTVEAAPDTEAPVITVDTTPITITAGDTLVPPTATCTDNADPSCTVNVDTSGVDTNTPGNYEIVYTATDSAGNASEVRVPVRVEVAISTPSINPIGTVTIDDNGGFLSSTVATITGSDIQAGATYSIVSGPAELSISGNVLTWNGDLNGGGIQSFTVVVEVENTDSGSDTETFTLNVNDNA